MYIYPDVPRLTEASMPLDSRELEFDINHEIRRTIVDRIRGVEPTNVLGVLLDNPEGMTAESIAEATGKPEGLIGWQVEKLAEEDLAVVASLDGVTKALPFARYTKKND